MAREWNLRSPLRWAILCCAIGYLLLARPWGEPDGSAAVGTYTCSLAFLVLALVPNRTRMWVAMVAAIAVPLLVEVVINVVQSWT